VPAVAGLQPKGHTVFARNESLLRRRRVPGFHRRRPRLVPSGSLLALLVGRSAGRWAARLRADGYAVATAGNLDRGLDLAQRLHPDLIFVHLGTWSVPALALLVLRATPATAGVPTVLISGRTAEEVAAEIGGLRPNEQVLRRPERECVSDP
jgi:hypothetical protein